MSVPQVGPAKVHKSGVELGAFADAARRYGHLDESGAQSVRSAGEGISG